MSTEYKEKKNGHVFSFVEPPKKEEEKFVPNFWVYRKRWWFFETLFCICEEVLSMDEVILCNSSGHVIAILPKDKFAYAINIDNR
jgi:hypothetical protein